MQSLTPLLNWVTSHPGIDFAYLGGAGAISLALEILLNKLHIDSKKLAFTLLHILTGLSAAATWILGDSGKAAVGGFAALTILAQTWHRFVISSGYAAVTNYLNLFMQFVSYQKNAVDGSTTPPPAPVVSPTPNATNSSQTVNVAKPFTLDEPVSAGK